MLRSAPAICARQTQRNRGAATQIFQFRRVPDRLGQVAVAADSDGVATALAGATGFVTMTVVPEPGAALLGSIGLLALLRRRR